MATPPVLRPDSWMADDDDQESIEIPAFIADPGGVLRRRWSWMLVSVVMGLAATAGVATTLKPTYVAKATVLITGQQIPEDFVRSTVQEDTVANIETMLGRALSQENLMRLIEEHGLYPNDRRNLQPSDLVSRIRSHITAAPTDGPRRGYTPSLIYGIEFESDDPIRAADVANSLAALLTEASNARRNEQARRTTEFLRRALESDEKELREQAGLVSEFRRVHSGELPDQLDTNLRKIDLASQRRESLSNQIQSLQNRLSTRASGPGTTGASENLLLLQELRRQLARELAVNTDEHPNVVALQHRVARLEGIVVKERAAPRDPDREFDRVTADDRWELERLRSQLAAIEAEIPELTVRVDRTPQIGEQLSALEEIESVLRDKYLGALRKVEDSELAESLESAQQGSQMSILDPAQVPTAPKRPRWMILAGGAAASFGLALALAVLLELVDPVVVSARQLESIAERPVLGTLPHIAV